VLLGDDTVALRRAQAGDLDAVLAVLNEAAGWLASRGVQQWPPRFDPAWLAGSVARGDAWLAEADGRAIGTVEFTRSDAAWGGRRGDSRYVHRLAVRREARGLGRLLLGWAGAEARRQECEWLRLDCVVGNAELRRYYERWGF
jgi:predicted N-acetyltransferase YhbS